MLVPFFQHLDQFRVLPQGRPDQPHGTAWFLEKSGGLGQDHHIFFIADGLEKSQGNGVRNRAVQIHPAVHFHDPGDQRHGSGGAHPLEAVRIHLVAALITGFSRVDIGTDQIKFRGIAFKRGAVEKVQFVRQFPVAEIGAEKIAGLPEGAPAAEPFVLAEALVVADHSADLVRLVVAAERRTGRDPDDAVEADLLLHQHIHDPGGKDPPHGSALQHQTVFTHCLLSFCCCGNIQESGHDCKGAVPAIFSFSACKSGIENYSKV